MTELWKDIAGFEGLYQVSNTGKIRSLDRKQKSKAGKVVSYKGKELKGVVNSTGYLRVELKAENRSEKWFIHRLVALHFVENTCPENTIVNHIDSNRLNNFASNLEWTTYRGNSQHALKNGRLNRTEKWKEHLRKSNEQKGKRVVGTNIKTGKKIYFVCLNDCKAAGFQPSSVCNCCKGTRATHKGYVWQYQEELKQ